MPFDHENYLGELTGLRDQLKARLSGRQPEADELTASELAERIKALKASQIIDATPRRSGQRSNTAAEPVTKRIRKRAEAEGAADAAVSSDPNLAGEESPASAKTSWRSMAEKLASLGVESAYTSNLRRPMTHQQRLEMERRRDDPEQTRS